MKIAELSDVDAILAMAVKFANSSGYKQFCDEKNIRHLIESLIDANKNEKIIILEEGKGFIAGNATPFAFGPHVLVTEIAWWVEPEARGDGTGAELLSAFEYWAHQKVGATMISMGCLDQSLIKFYKKQGYKLYERAYMKVF